MTSRDNWFLCLNNVLRQVQVGLLRHPLAVPQCFTASRADGGGFDASDAVWIEDKGVRMIVSSRASSGSRVCPCVGVAAWVPSNSR